MLLELAFKVMGLGLLGVFSALTILFFTIKILGKLFPQKPDQEQ